MSKNLDEVMSRKEEKRVMSYIPNMMTIANFICGILAIYSVFAHDMYGAVMFIITGMIFDLFDGMVARKLGSVSEIGGELDSFADLVTFGVAPSILAYTVALKDLQSIGMVCALAYSVCGMLRLARFNTRKANSRPLSACQFHSRQCVSSFYVFKESSFRGVWYMHTRVFNGE